jgi:hypothetical protein
MDYPACEALCMQALDAARQAQDWDTYTRIVLPLQEARRQRRMIAAEGVIRLGTTDCDPDARQWLTHIQTGCVVVTQPFDAAAARTLQNEARQGKLFIEVLLADNRADAATWTLRSFASRDVRCQVAAPPQVLRDRWLASSEAGAAADWFLDAMEALGDAALAQVEPSLQGALRIAEIEKCLQVVTDHEILHQRLGDLARAMH